jgi:hypothetical protein
MSPLNHQIRDARDDPDEPAQITEVVHSARPSEADLVCQAFWIVDSTQFKNARSSTSVRCFVRAFSRTRTQ